MIKEMKIGGITLKNRYVLAPMAGYTNYPYRKLASECGAGLVYTEMISSTALVYGNHKTLEMLPTVDEGKVALQLFGGDKETIIKSIPIVENNSKYDFLDFNLGCPVPKVMKQHAGSYWLKRTDELYDLFSSMVKVSHKPVLIKMRLGFSKDSINALEVARIAKEAGVSALAIHGRTRDEYYGGLPHYDAIAQIKSQVDIPVIANGNISPTNIDEVMNITNCDGYMIGRETLGNPMVFNDLLTLEEDGVLEVRKLVDQLNLMKRHYGMLVEMMGEKNATKYFRGLSVLYLKGFSNSKMMKNRLVQMNDSNDFYQIIDEIEHFSD